MRLLELIDTLKAIAEDRGDLQVFSMNTGDGRWEDAEVELRREKRFLDLPEALNEGDWWVSVGPL